MDIFEIGFAKCSKFSVTYSVVVISCFELCHLSGSSIYGSCHHGV